jgi:nucleoid DNA-binding protein
MSLPIKEQIIKKLAINRVAKDKLVSEKDIEAVITHQYDSAYQATFLHNTIEISGFGKFIFSQKKGNKELTSLQAVEKNLLTMLDNTELSTNERRKTDLKLKTVQTNIKQLKPKLYADQ